MGCEECGFYWNFPDEDELCPVCESKRLRKRVDGLEDAIRKHKREFPDEPMIPEIELWAHLPEGGDGV